MWFKFDYIPANISQVIPILPSTSPTKAILTAQMAVVFVWPN